MYASKKCEKSFRILWIDDGGAPVCYIPIRVGDLLGRGGIRVRYVRCVEHVTECLVDVVDKCVAHVGEVDASDESIGPLGECGSNGLKGCLLFV